ncbi:MAG: hypothetical protein WAV73_01485 [Candidatus Moraniibacteriota bacterium]
MKNVSWNSDRCFTKRILPNWNGLTGTLTLRFVYESIFEEGVYYNGCINGRYKVKKRDLPLLKGISGNKVYFLPSVQKYRGASWAKAVYLYEPMPPQVSMLQVIFQLGDKLLSLSEAVMLKRIIYLLEDGVGVTLRYPDSNWEIVPPHLNLPGKKTVTQPITGFQHFLQKYWRALKVMGPLPEYPNLDMLKAIYLHWRKKPIPLSHDVAEGLEMLAAISML